MSYCYRLKYSYQFYPEQHLNEKMVMLFSTCENSMVRHHFFSNTKQIAIRIRK